MWLSQPVLSIFLLLLTATAQASIWPYHGSAAPATGAAYAYRPAYEWSPGHRYSAGWTGSPIVVKGPEELPKAIIGPSEGPVLIEGPRSGAATIVGPSEAGATIVGPSTGAATIVGPSSGAARIIGPSSGAATIVGSGGARIVAPGAGGASIFAPASGGASIIAPGSGGATIIGPSEGGAQIVGPSSGAATIIGPTSAGATIVGPKSAGATIIGSSAGPAVIQGGAYHDHVDYEDVQAHARAEAHAEAHAHANGLLDNCVTSPVVHVDPPRVVVQRPHHETVYVKEIIPGTSIIRERPSIIHDQHDYHDHAVVNDNIVCAPQLLAGWSAAAAAEAVARAGSRYGPVHVGQVHGRPVVTLSGPPSHHGAIVGPAAPIALVEGPSGSISTASAHAQAHVDEYPIRKYWYPTWRKC